MPAWLSRIAKVVLIGMCVVLALAAFLSIFARFNRPAFMREYFYLEQQWVEHWPVVSQKWEIEKLAPYACRIGLLAPVRLEVEPGISFLLDPRDLVPATILRTGQWQPEVWDSVSPCLSEGGVFLDVGAHIGYFSIKAARKVGKTGHVLAFEPNPETLKLLRENVAVNHTDNVLVEPIACTDREQTLTLYAGPSINTGMSSLDSRNVPLEGAPRAYAVRGRPIDDVIRELNLTRVDAIKVDVEGAEAFVIRGAMETLKRFHPRLVVEVISDQLANFGTRRDDLIALIRSAGYDHSRPLNPEATDWEWIAGSGSPSLRE